MCFKISAAEPTAGEASIEATIMEAASAKTAFMAAAASERHSRLNQADCRKYEQNKALNVFRIMLPSIGTISFPRNRHFLQRDYSAIE
jgi:hypothetical protein